MSSLYLDSGSMIASGEIPGISLDWTGVPNGEGACSGSPGDNVGCFVACRTGSGGGAWDEMSTY